MNNQKEANVLKILIGFVAVMLLVVIVGVVLILTKAKPGENDSENASDEKLEEEVSTDSDVEADSEENLVQATNSEDAVNVTDQTIVFKGQNEDGTYTISISGLAEIEKSVMDQASLGDIVETKMGDHYRVIDAGELYQANYCTDGFETANREDYDNKLSNYGVVAVEDDDACGFFLYEFEPGAYHIIRFESDYHMYDGLETEYIVELGDDADIQMYQTIDDDYRLALCSVSDFRNIEWTEYRRYIGDATIKDGVILSFEEYFFP